MSHQFRRHIKKRGKDIYNHKVFRFIISGGLATVVDISTYFVCFHFIFDERNQAVPIFHLFSVSSAIVSLITSFSAGFITSFTINKLFVFKESELRTRHQLVRFAAVAALVFVLNYAFMKLMIDWVNIHPTIARIVSSATISVLSFSMHNIFTFKTKNKKK